MKVSNRFSMTVIVLMAMAWSSHAAITLEKINSLSTGLGEGSSEISSYDVNSEKLFVIN